jgi:predicted kinase
VQASEGTLRRRIALRAATGTDASEASEAVLERQLASQEQLTSEERVWTRSFDGERITPENVTPQLLAIAPTVIAGDH